MDEKDRVALVEQTRRAAQYIYNRVVSGAEEVFVPDGITKRQIMELHAINKTEQALKLIASKLI